MTLIGAGGRVLAYADRAAIGSCTVGFSGVSFAPSMLLRLLGRRIRRVTALVGGRPRLVLIGLRLSVPTGEQPLPGGGWACDAAIGTFQKLVRLRGSHTHETKK